ncbi:MAG: hypothetical protein WHX93_10935 [bacterium]
MGLNPRQERGLAALLSAPTLGAAAAEANVSVATLRRWLRTPEFIRAYAQLRSEINRVTVVRLQNASRWAVDTLCTALVAESTPPAVKVSAAKAILEYAFRSTEQLDLLERVEMLERLIEESRQ